MNLSPRFYVIEDEKTSFYAGYCVKPKNNTDLYKLCEALNSNLKGEYINLVSKSYRGGYKSYAKSCLKDFVHPQFYKSQPALFYPKNMNNNQFLQKIWRHIFQYFFS